MQSAVRACAAVVVLGSLSAQAEPGRWIVEWREAPPGRAAVLAAGGSIVLELPPQNAAAVLLPGRAVEALRRHPHIAALEPDPERHPFAQSTPYGIELVQAPQTWPDATGANRRVCVIDSGYHVAHEDLPSSGVQGHPQGWSIDRCGHGTHVAGTIAALNDTKGVVGVVPGIDLHVVKVFGDDCRWAYASDLVDALNRCRSAGSHVVSMSLGGSFKSRTEERAFSQAWDAGVLSVAAAGNSGSGQHSYPASYPSVVSVAAVDAGKRVAWFSQYNSQVELAAPGVSVLSTVPWVNGDESTVGSGYEAWSGTSMATPHVSGVAALVWSANTSWTNVQLREALRASAEDLGASGRDDHYGYGLVRARAALDLLQGDGGGGAPPPSTDVVLGLRAWKEKGLQRVDLMWSGAQTPTIDVRRDGRVIATVSNSGSWTDAIGARGGGTYRYRVCEVGDEGRCSNEATAIF